MAPPPCELCRGPSNFHCPSDEAFLCWNCDSAVHSANFLVARHIREFLCRCCSRRSSLMGTGAVLPPHSCICIRCSMEALPGDSDSECSLVTSDSESDSNTVLYASDRACKCNKTGDVQGYKVMSLPAAESGYASEAMSTVEEELSSSADSMSGSSSTCSTGDGGHGTLGGKHQRSHQKFSRA